MRWTRPALAVVVLAGLWLVFDLSRRPLETGERPAGIEFVIPGDYTVFELGETDLRGAAGEILRALGQRSKVAAVFTRSGDQFQFLVDRDREKIDERVIGSNGTVRVVVWRDSVQARLEWASNHGDLSVPGLPPPERRNPYH